MIPYGRQEITEDDIIEVKKILRSDFLTQGPTVPRFEKAIATRVIGDDSAVACCSEVVTPRSWSVGAFNYIFFILVVKVAVFHKVILWFFEGCDSVLFN